MKIWSSFSPYFFFIFPSSYLANPKLYFFLFNNNKSNIKIIHDLLLFFFTIKISKGVMSWQRFWRIFACARVIFDNSTKGQFRFSRKREMQLAKVFFHRCCCQELLWKNDLGVWSTLKVLQLLVNNDSFDDLMLIYWLDLKYWSWKKNSIYISFSAVDWKLH